MTASGAQSDRIPVTVLTAVRNGERHVGEAIASIQAQTYPDWEYIVVDDASQDRTVEVVTSFMASDPRIRLIRRKTGGNPFAAANEGLRASRGRYVFRLDADDVAAPHRIEHQLAFLAEHPELRACAGGGRLLSRPDSRVGQTRMLPATPGSVRWHLCVRRNLRHTSACVERTAFEAVGGYRELPAAQDLRLWCDLSRQGWVGVTPEILVFSRRHPESVTRRIPAVQRQLAIAALGDHIEALTGESWSPDDLAVLWGLQRTSVTSPLRDGLRVLGRWEEAWRNDAALTAEDRAHLRRLKRSLVTRLMLQRKPVSAVLRRATALVK